MNDELQKLRKRWIGRAIAAFIVLVSYEAIHFTTVRYKWSVRVDDLGRNISQVQEDHWLGNRPVPPWLERIFGPATRIDARFDLYPSAPRY
jgi:hypothetical protein